MLLNPHKRGRCGIGWFITVQEGRVGGVAIIHISDTMVGSAVDAVLSHNARALEPGRELAITSHGVYVRQTIKESLLENWNGIVCDCFRC